MEREKRSRGKVMRGRLQGKERGNKSGGENEREEDIKLSKGVKYRQIQTQTRTQLC